MHRRLIERRLRQLLGSLRRMPHDGVAKAGQQNVQLLRGSAWCVVA